VAPASGALRYSVDVHIALIPKSLVAELQPWGQKFTLSGCFRSIVGLSELIKTLHPFFIQEN
jgi:hypothetical protein